MVSIIEAIALGTLVLTTNILYSSSYIRFEELGIDSTAEDF